MSADPAESSKPAPSNAKVRLEQLAHELAQYYVVSATSRLKARLPEHLQNWERALQAAYAVFKTTPTKDLAYSRASEWMLDNYYIVKQTQHQVDEDLPETYLNQLPKLDTDGLKSYPRIFGLAWELVGAGRAQLDLAQVAPFIQAYQEVTPLTTGELWALPTMLRIAILEQLAQTVANVTGYDGFQSVDARRQLPGGPEIANEVIVANCFNSLRVLAVTDWKTFFENASRVEQILSRDPAGIYSDMDFETRNSYRQVVEQLAWHSGQTEEAIAQTAIDFAREAQSLNLSNQPGSDRKAHIGFYLIDAGRRELEQKVGYRPAMRERIGGWLLARPTLSYLGGIAFISGLLVSLLLLYAIHAGGSLAQLILVAAIGSSLALDAAIRLVQWEVTHIVPPRALPRMDFTEAIPAEFHTMVVIPTLLSDPREVEGLLQELELHYLCNPDPHLSFALLTDYADAPAEHMPGDDTLVSTARAGIENLNHKYPQEAPFYLFHRVRQWNPSEGKWMGWERKRGKLVELNRLILDGDGTSYTTKVGNLAILHEIKYVITLDTDTSLPQGSANRLVAALAHPLNRAEFAPDGLSVCAGYTILQPRVEIKPTSANRTLFSRIFAGDVGFDLYTLAVSDVYQDLFGEGSYIGKGIYDVAGFEKSLAGQVRENALLSHDLFEGINGRAALVTDVVLYEDYPAHYLTYARRLHRWIRGDWQLLPWLLRTVETEAGTARNHLSLINRWKIFDNLRRSLLPPTYLAVIIAAWLYLLPGSALIWTVVALLTPAAAMIVQTIQDIANNLGHSSWKELFEPSRLPATRWLLSVLFLPYEAWLMLNAIGVTLVRMYITHRHLLQWTTSAHMARLFGSKNKYEDWGEMSGPLIFTIVLTLVTLAVHPAVVLMFAAPLLAGWIISPGIAYRISQPILHHAAELTHAQHKHIQRLARRTWAFFEQFAGPDDHWLPPDHFQEAPRGIVAHYTTPTNIGLFLLGTLAAYDLGYIGLLELAVRLRSTFENMQKLEHYRGHLLNWYDTQTMAPLAPRYVSTVDSGNLAGSLISLQQGLLTMKERPLVGSHLWQGMLVILDILTDILKEFEEIHPVSMVESFEVALDNIRERILAIQEKPEAWVITLSWLSNEGWEHVSRRLMEILENPPVGLDPGTLNELKLYLDTLHHHLSNMQRNIEFLAPWLNYIDRPPDIFIGESGEPAQAWRDFLRNVPAELPRLGQAGSVYLALKSALAQLHEELNDPALAERNAQALDWCEKLSGELDSAHLRAETLLIGYNDLAGEANLLVNAMDFKFLFDPQRQIFHIGYNVATEQLDSSFYDLLASEARIASLIAIAKGDVPQSHWLHLARPVTEIRGKQTLLSWSGTMFEYLMPLLLTRNYEGTFLSESCYTAIRAQIDYGQQNHIPWGISESGFMAFDTAMNYQYRAFGVPDLGFKRDLPGDLVATPYASLLAIGLEPREVMNNIERLQQLKMLGRFGLYEAIDYTKTHLPANETFGIVQSYMAHHQGMILLAACNFLEHDVFVERFHADARIQSVDLLLQEKIPSNPHFEYPHPDEPGTAIPAKRSLRLLPWRVAPASPLPLVHFLSQGDHSLMLTSTGAGFSQWKDIALTRWHADATTEQWGTWIYVHDMHSDELWSVTSQPTGGGPETQEVLYLPHKVEFRRWDHGLSLHAAITIGADGVEVRRVTILNDSDHLRHLKLTSYAEVVLAARSTDQRHPAFNKLFIESEFVQEAGALLFHRRPRSSDESPIHMAHALVVEMGSPAAAAEYENDRARFLGRGRTVQAPRSLEQENRSSASPDGTLDPIMSLSQEIEVKPHSRVRVTFVTMAGSSRAEVLGLVARYQSTTIINRAFEDAHSQSEKELIDLAIDPGSVEAIQKLLSVLVYPSDRLRAAPHILAKNTKGQPGLWAYGISGDYPILLLRIHDADTTLLGEALQAYVYWRNRHLVINLVILNEQDTGYSLDLHNQIYRQIAQMGAEAWLHQREGIFLLRTDQIPKSDRVLLETVAGAILNDKKGSLADHAGRLAFEPTRLPAFIPALQTAQDLEPTAPLARPAGLQMDNGLGGFSADGREYVMYLEPGQNTPHPWVNVIANPNFGFLVSEAGSACTWAENSGENRLTPWRNDPLTDMPGETIYLRDEETGLIWSPTPMPVGPGSACVIRHGAGYSTFENQSHGLSQRLRVFAAPDAPIKIAQLRVENLWNRPRRITVTYYAEWVLGTTRDVNQAFIVPEFEPGKHAILASNRYNSEFGDRVAFLAANKKPHGVTADRSEFIGRLGSLKSPAALHRIGLAGTVRAGLDPCAAIQLHIDLAPGQSEEVFFLLGQGANRTESLALISAYQVQERVESTWQAVQHQWDDILGTITVQTPEPGMDLMLNRWLLYQTLACRLWGRTALYQSSGAFGFRDQLQDVMALLHARPALTREQLLNAARHQFEAGDVLHWWNPPLGRGVRTRISDDLLWLPYVTAEYVRATGDISILEEQLPFLKGQPLAAEEIERYNIYESTSETYTLYEHCRRALDKGSTAGSHDLPLMGTGDWNDGLNLVGVKGRGESIWLGWFLHATLMRFADLRVLMKEDPAPYRAQAARLAQALETNAWDGKWYLRAYYDDGSRLGSSRNNECQIDSIAQSWAVLSGAGDPAHATQAMESVYELLVHQADQLIELFTPPFDKTVRDPGYIRGYTPGVRENGGQYTHAAIWSVWAFAALGQGDRAEALFRLLNPVHHTDTPEKVERYKVEPYGVVADVYSVAPHTGTGGWTWYTGSAGWMYRLGIEAILGIKREGNVLVIDPCIPAHWPGYKVDYRFGATHYLISIENPHGLNRGVQQVSLNGIALPDQRIPLSDDQRQHEVRVTLGTAEPQPDETGQQPPDSAQEQR